MHGADIVVTGRVADSALALGPLMHAFGWKADDWRRLAAGTLAGHLLECGSQITGGYFADPPYKNVPGLADLGYPIAEIDSDGAIVIAKPAGTGGRIDRQTVIEQMLYEIHDPAAYLVPDVVLDLTDVEVEEIGADRVRVTGARGKPAPRDAQGHRLHRRGTVRRSRDFLCRAECRRARAACRRDHRRADENARARIDVSHRCHRRHQHSWRFRRRAQKAMAVGHRRHPPALCRAIGRTRPRSNFCWTRSKRFIAPAPPAAPACAGG